MYQETSEPLSTEDYNVIAEKKSELLKYIVIIPVFIIVAGFLISLAINAEDFKDVKGIFFGFLSFMVLIACGAIFYMYNSVQKAGQNGVKTVIIGIINEKKRIKSKEIKLVSYPILS